MNHPANLLVALTFVTIPLSAQQYVSVFHKATGGHALWVKNTKSNIAKKVADMQGINLRMRDVKSYRDANGEFRIDTVWGPGTYREILMVDVPWSRVKAVHDVNNGYFANQISVHLNDNAEPRYTVVFQPEPTHLFGPESMSSFHQRWLDEGARGYRARDIECFWNRSGALTMVSTFFRISGGGYYAFNPGHTLSSLATQVARYRSQFNMEMTHLRSYTDDQNRVRYMAYYHSQAPEAKYFVHSSQSAFGSNWNTQVGIGYRLMQIDVDYMGRSASTTPYGTGTKGADRIPDLTLQSLPVLGRDNALLVTNSQAAPTNGIIFVGVAATSVPFLGGNLLVNPLASLPLSVQTGTTALPVFTPANPMFDGLLLTMQVMMLDSAAPGGVSMSRGIQVRHGRRD